MQSSKECSINHKLHFIVRVSCNLYRTYMDSIRMEANEIKLHPRNVNRDGGFTFSQAWYPVTYMLKQYVNPPMQRQTLTEQTPDSAHKPPHWLTLKSHMWIMGKVCV